MRGDPTRLRQVLSNLLGNAIKFTPRGEVRLRVTAQPMTPGDARAWWCFAVEDTGIGIAPDAIDRLFQRFSQADASTTRQFGGTGLGIGISRHQVELMGGQIHVSSVPEEGSCFRFDVPFQPAETAHALAMAPRKSPDQTRRAGAGGRG